MTRTFIYGSCVSRDTFERLPRDRFELVQYVARQSLISATAPAPHVPPPAFETSSAFQRRMLLGDWESSLLPSLESHAGSVDLLLWDLCDERLGLRQIEPAVPAGTPAVVTRSVDSIRAGVDARLEPAPQIAFGSRRHRLMFLHSLRAFLDALSELDLLEKTLVLAPAWANRTAAGLATPSSFGLPADRANRLYADYYSAIEKTTRLPILRVPPRDARADPDHPWGVAPFHYTEDVYTRLASQIRGHVRDRP